MTFTIAWGITGCGDNLRQSIETMISLKKIHGVNIHVILSKAADTVVTWYKLWDVIKENFDKVFIESTPNTPFLVGPLQLGKYNVLIICPATANTTAKIAHGIADSLLTNCVAQAIKAGMQVYIFPVDQESGEVVTVLPDGKEITLSMRDIDVENARKLRLMNGITVLSSPKDVELAVRDLLRGNEK